jgi:O-antigen/teichoic acid export membrane protein
MSLYSSGNARRSLIQAAIYRVAAQVSTAVGYVVLVRAMSKEDFGVFNLLYSIIPVMSLFASLGLEQTLRRYQPVYLQTANVAGAAWLFRVISSTRFASNLLLLLAVLVLWNVVAPVFKIGPYRAEFLLFSVAILLHFQCNILQLSFSSHMQQRFSVGSIALMSVVKLVAYAALAWKGRLDLETAILTDTVAFALTFVMLRWAHARHCTPISAGRGFKLEPDERRRMVRYGLYNNFNDMGSLALSTRFDNFFLAGFINPLSVGIYSFYSRLEEMLSNMLPVRMFESVIQPMFFATPKADAPARAPRFFSLLLNMNLILQWPTLAYAVAFHEQIVGVIFGAKYLDDSWLLPMFLAVALINTVSVPATLVAQYEEKADIVLYSKVFALFNILALFVLVPWLGLYGALLASGSSQTLKNYFIWWHVRDLARWTNAGAALLSSFALWGAVVLACYGIKLVPGLPGIAMLFIGAVICGAAALLHLRSPALSTSDRQILETVMAGKESRLLRLVGLLPRLPGPG